MNKTVVAIVAVIVVLVGIYGGYRVVKHEMRINQQATVQKSNVAVKQPASSPSATMAANSIYLSKTDPKLGAYMTDPKGMTLYTYTKDTNGTSNCTGVCLAIWPAYKATSKNATLPTNISIITRSDGTLQYAWKGKPLYYYKNDTKPGDINGQGVGGLWFVAK